jgi:predicted dienelactone hydrolase
MWKSSLNITARAMATATIATIAWCSPMTEAAPRPDAPRYARTGPESVGVTTVRLQDSSRNRILMVEVWYPMASNGKNTGANTPYTSQVGNVRVNIPAQASRNANAKPGPWPLVVVSHGQPGNRYMLSYLAEHLASYGLVVAAIDHTGSTYGDISQSAYISSLTDRPQDILFVIGALPKAFTVAGSNANTINSNNTALVGYSYGGYSSLNAAGVGLDEANLRAYCKSSGNEGPCFALPFFSSLKPRSMELVKPQPNIKAVMIMAPYGAPWLSPKQLAGLQLPLFVACGDQDDVARYERDAKTIFTTSQSKHKYLLTLEGALHNPWVNTPPAETRGQWSEYERWSEPVWDKERSHDITKHFTAAFLLRFLRNDANAGQMLAENLPSFLPRTTTGVRLEVGGQ